MRLILEADDGLRVTVENLDEEALAKAISTLLEGAGFISSTYIGNGNGLNPEGSARPANARPVQNRRTKDVSKRARAIAEGVLSDGEWHTKEFVAEAWKREGLNLKTADIAMRSLEGLRRSRKNGRAWWKLEGPPEPEPVAQVPEAQSTYHGTWGGNGSGGHG